MSVGRFSDIIREVISFTPYLNYHAYPVDSFSVFNQMNLRHPKFFLQKMILSVTVFIRVENGGIQIYEHIPPNLGKLSTLRITVTLRVNY